MIGGAAAEGKATKVAKSISSIFLTEEAINQRANNLYKGDKEKVYTEMVSKYNACTGENMTVEDKDKFIIRPNNEISNKYYKYACMIYEYMQFKRSVFECTRIKYDEGATGRVTEMDFYFVKVR